MTQRTDRIDQILRQEISQALEREVSDPRIGFVTVTDVETVADLSRAKVWVSIIGSDSERSQLKNPSAPHPGIGCPARRLDGAWNSGPSDPR
jgi:ribosome-binding factor A